MLRSWMLRDAPFVKHRACVSYLSNSVPGPSLPANYLCWQGWSSELYWTLFVYALSSPRDPWNSEIWDGDHVSPGVPAIPGRFFLWWRLWPYQMRHTEKGKDSQQLVFFPICIWNAAINGTCCELMIYESIQWGDIRSGGLITRTRHYFIRLMYCALTHCRRT